jgi:hypothetical protein
MIRRLLDNLATVAIGIAIFVGLPIALAYGCSYVTGGDPDCPPGQHWDVVGESRFEGELYGCVPD